MADPEGGPGGLRRFTWEEIGQRSGRGPAPQERWLVIERKVYDISRFCRSHPGGSRVISHYAGQDATVSGPGGAEGGMLGAGVPPPGASTRGGGALGTEARRGEGLSGGIGAGLCSTRGRCWPRCAEVRGGWSWVPGGCLLLVPRGCLLLVLGPGWVLLAGPGSRAGASCWSWVPGGC